MNRMIRLKQTTPVFLVVLLLCFGVSQAVQAVVPAPDGGYPNFNTAEGQKALFSLTIGQGNTAVGWFTLESLTTGTFNTAMGAAALVLNTGDQNTATGAGALLSNTTGVQSTANGAFALFSNTEGNLNTAIGDQALFNNTTGFANTANGEAALFSNTEGSSNTANGVNALVSNTTGGNNTALGFGAGNNVITASNVICIGANQFGENVSNSCYIGQIFGATSAGGIAVLVNSDGKLGTVVSSRRFKGEIQPMKQASETLFSLKPVTFRYKEEIDPAGTSQFGLVAEDVEKVNPDLIVRDKEGKAYSVRYDQVNAMLLNEFLKAHGKLQEQEAAISRLNATVSRQEATGAEQQREIQALSAGLQKVSAQLKASKPSPQVAANNR